MAKNWTYNKETGILTRSYTVKVVDEKIGKESLQIAAPDLSIDMNEVYINADWSSFDEVEVNNSLNGMKQKLDDSIARSKDSKLTEAEKREEHEKLVKRMLEGRKWNMEAKEIGPRGPSVSLATIVPPLVEAGFTAEVIAKMCAKSVEVIQKFIDTGEEEETSN